MKRRVGLVGLGSIAEIQLKALERLPEIDVVAGVDPAPATGLSFRGTPRPIYTSPNQLVNHHDLDDIIVSTPSPSHAAVCDELLASTSTARILVEKPLATTIEAVQRLLGVAATRSRIVEVLYHFRYSPEVRWAAELVPQWIERHGPIGEFICSFSDPYQTVSPDRRASYVSSWIDSGINAISLLDRFVTLTDSATVTCLTAMFETFSGVLGFTSDGHHGQGRVMTSWQAGQSSKWSHLRMSDGTRLFLDHSASLAWILAGNARPGGFGTHDGLGRHLSRYLFMLTDLFNPDRPATPPAFHLHLHRILLERAPAAGVGGATDVT